MSEAVKKFNSLNGTLVSEKEIQKIYVIAGNEEQTFLAQRLAKALAQSKSEKCTFKIDSPAIEQVPACELPGIDLLPNYIDEEEFTGLNKAVSPDDIYQYITNLIVDTISKVGHLPWQREWEKTALFNGKQALNFESKKGYRGINFFLLNFEVKEDKNGDKYLVAKNWKNPYFLTFNQITKNKGKLKKGSSGIRVVYFTQLYSFEEIKKDGKKLPFSTYSQSKFKAWLTKNGIDANKYGNNYIPILKYYNVFNAEDVEGVDWKTIPKNTNADKPAKARIQIAEDIVSLMPNPPKIIFKGDQPAYYPSLNQILMTPIGAFKNEESYYSTLFHELIHSTKHKSRLNDTTRGSKGKSDKKGYAFEELIAEMGAVFLCAESGILFSTINNSAKYLHGWNKSLVTNMKEDNRFFFRAASKSQAASDYILDKNKEGVAAYQSKPDQNPINKNIIVGYALVDNITGQIAATKKTLPELEKYYRENVNKDFKNMTPLVYEIFKASTKNKLGKKLEGFSVKKGKITPTKAPKQKVSKPKKVNLPKFKNGQNIELVKQWGKSKKGAKGKISQRKQRVATNGDFLYRVTVGNTSLIYPEEVLKLVTLVKKTPSVKIMPIKKREELLKKIRNTNLTAKNKTEFEKQLKNLGFEIIDTVSKNHSPNNFERTYKLNYKDAIGVTLVLKVATQKETKDLKADFNYNSFTGKFEDSYTFYENVANIYEVLLDYLKQDFSVSVTKAIQLRKKFSKTLFEKKNKQQLALFGLMATAQNKDTVSFNKKVLEAKQNNKFKNVEIIYLGETQGLLKKHIGGSKMYIAGGTLNKSMKKDSDHIATWESFINLPDNINNPLIILRSKTKGFVVLTEIKNHKEKPLMVAIHFNNKMKITEVKSIYAKNNLSIYSQWAKDNLVVFANKKSDLVKRIFAPIAKSLTKSHYKNTKNNPNTKKGLKSPIQNTPKTNEVEREISGENTPPRPSVKRSKILSASDIMNKQFETLQFNNGWEQLFQEPAKNMKIAIWGKPKNGKSASACQLASYLTNFGTILYNFADQGFSQSTKNLLALSGLDKKDNAFFTSSNTIEELKADLNDIKPQFVVIDMINDYINKSGLKYHEFKENIIKQYPDIGFILIFEVTKNGDFKGDQGWTHVVDGLVTIEDYIATSKGRYGMGERIMWEEGAKKFNPKRYAEIKGETITETTTAPEPIENKMKYSFEVE